MATLDHTIVPSNDKDQSARFFARMFDLPYEGAGHFAPVRVNDQLTLDFASASNVESMHYAFLVTEDEFDSIFGRIQSEEVSFGAGRAHPTTGRSIPGVGVGASISGVARIRIYGRS